MRYDYKVLVYIFLAAFLSAVCAFAFSGSASAAPAAKPVFEVPALAEAPSEAGSPGGLAAEEEIVDYDEFYLPAAFCADAASGLTFVLDPAARAIRAFSNDGRPAGELKIPYGHPASDLAWHPGLGAFFVVFSDRPQIAVLEAGLKDGLALRSHKLVELEGISEMGPGIQNIWPCPSPGGKDAIFVLTFNSAADAPGASFVYGGERFLKLRDMKGASEGMAASHEKPCLYSVDADGASGAALVEIDARSGKTSRTALPEELRPDGSAPAGCVSCRAIGADAAGNVYLEAHFSRGEISESAFVYKLDRNMKLAGRAEIFTSPEMVSNRYIFVDAEGAVRYMKLDPAARRIQFYKFGF